MARAQWWLGLVPLVRLLEMNQHRNADYQVRVMLVDGLR